MKTFSETFRSLSILVLAASIFFFGYALLQSVNRLSEGLQHASGLAESVKPVVELAPKFLEESEQLRALTRDVLAETEAVRMLVPPVLGESEAIRKTLPPMMQQAELWRQESAQVRAEIAAVRVLVPEVLDELDAYRALVPTVLAESQNIRRTIPPTLDRVEKIVLEANEIATTAGESAFTGVLTGIIKAPINLLGKLVPSDAKLSDQDRDRLENRLQAFLQTAEVGDVQEFVTSDGSVNGRFEVMSDSFANGEVCRTLGLKSFRKGKLLKDEDLQVCRDENDRWALRSVD